MKNVLLLLRENKENMPTAEATVAKYICENPEECAHLTVRELAEKTYSSPSSIVRMCRFVGFDGYSYFRLELFLVVYILWESCSHEET